MSNREKQLEELFMKRKTEIRHGRLVVPIPNASKCAYDKCAMCAYNKNSSSNIGGISENEQWNLVNRYLLDAEDIIKNKKIMSVDLYCSGSLLSPTEVYPNVLLHLIDFFKKTESLKEINIESLPNFVKPEILAYIQQELSDKMLSISIGWETSNEGIRKNIWKKQISNKMYEKALTVIKSFDNVHAKYFVLVGLPDVSEQESIEECLTSVREALEKGNLSIELQPTSVMEGTIVEKYYYDGRFSPISIRSLVTIAKEVKKHFEQRETYVGKFCVSTYIKPEPMVENTSAKKAFKKFNASMQKIWEEEILQNWPQNINHERYMRKINKVFEEFN